MNTALLDQRCLSSFPFLPRFIRVFAVKPYPLVNEKYNACLVDSVKRNGCAGR